MPNALREQLRAHGFQLPDYDGGGLVNVAATVLDLVRAGPRAAAGGESAEIPVRTDGFGDAGAVLDPQAKAAYRHRLEELEQEADEAEAGRGTGSRARPSSSTGSRS